MNAYWRMMAAIRREPPREIPVAPFIMTFAARHSGMHYSDYVRDGRNLATAQIKVCRDFDLDMVTVSSDPYREAHDCGVEVAFPPDDVPYSIRPAIQQEADLARLEAPDPRHAPRMADRLLAVRMLAQELHGTVPVVGWVESPLAEYCFLRGVMQAMTDLVDRPAFVGDALDFILEMEQKFAQAQIEAGADIIGVGEAVASLISPYHYRVVSLPRVKRLFRFIHDHGAPIKYHVCGSTTHLIRDFAESGADIVVVDSQVRLSDARAGLAGRACIKGNIHPLDLIMSTDRGALVRKARAAIDEGGPGGFILSLGCELGRDTPPRNLEALVEAARTYEVGGGA